MIYFPCKRFIAHILLVGQLLTSCGNPHYLRMGAWRSSNRSSPAPSTLCRVICTAPRPIPLPPGAMLHFYKNGSSCWAELRSGPTQSVNLPVRFSDQFTATSLARSDPTWQAQYIHLYPASTDSLEPSFVYIGGSSASSPKQDDLLSETASSTYLASGTTPSSASSLFRYTFLKDPGYRIVLSPDGDRWQAMVHDNRFSGLSRSYPASVAFEKGYCLDDFMRKDSAYQSHHTHLFSTNKDNPMVYIGSLGLKGGTLCPKCKYFTWLCYGCGANLCSCCKTHCNKFNYGVCSAKERVMQQQQLQKDLQNRNKLRCQKEEIEALKSKRKVLEEDLMRGFCRVYICFCIAFSLTSNFGCYAAIIIAKLSKVATCFLDPINCPF